MNVYFFLLAKKNGNYVSFFFSLISIDSHYPEIEVARRNRVGRGM